jgi:16S rRNA G966 N2-methylase RsmD
VLKRNIETLGLTDRATIVRGDAMQQLASVKGATLIVADPPYEFVKWHELLDLVQADFVVAESDRDMALENPAITGWEVTRVKRYGRAYVSFLQRLA